MIITDESQLRNIVCVDVLPEEVDGLRKLLEEELAASAKNGFPGIGLAAPQIGIKKNMAIIRINDEYSVDLVNCDIVAKYDSFLFDGEGCLSFPGQFESTMRYNEIHVKNNMVEPHEFIATGLFAVVIDHEMDHLVGRVLPDFAIKKPKNKLRPNDPCNCGSGSKYKKCCGK